MTADWKYFRKGIKPVCTIDPSPTAAPAALIDPTPIPIPAFLDMYFTIEVAVALMESRESPDSIRTQEEN